MNAAAGVLKAGVKASDVFTAARQVLIEAKTMPAVEMVGHGIGLDIHEPPSLDANNDMALQEGMTICIEVWLIDENWRSKGGGGLYGYEDIFVVKEDGYELIEGLDHSIIKVDHPIL
ncbi:MAG: M24 family metallopeptidase [Deltaproteobacteria bacterium]|nr:M24 family metallopeptidase [Deltaproteobacteria bacterium]